MSDRVIAVALLSCSLCLAACNKMRQNGEITKPQAADWICEGAVTALDTLLLLEETPAKATLANYRCKDFVWKSEVRLQEGAKGYIAFHTDESGKGYRVALHNDLNDSIWWRSTGSLLAVRNITKRFYDDSDWFNLEIRVEEKRIRIFLGEQVVVDYVEPDQPYRTKEHQRQRLSEGTFSLVNESEEPIEFRNISCQKLPPADEPQLQPIVEESTDPIIRLHQSDFPVLDYHVHLKGGLTKEAAAEQSRRLGINYAVSPNCGVGFPITSDEDIAAYIDTMRAQPFLLAMQAEGREWLTTFSLEACAAFDFRFTDALTFFDEKGRRTRLWINEEVFIEDEQKYMDLIVERICSVLQEPVAIYVNPFFLPEALNDRYDFFWTDARIDTVIAALSASGKALELNELYRIPNEKMVKKAKAAGVKFTFGSNNITPQVSDLSHSLSIKESCNLTAQDMYNPYR